METLGFFVFKSQPLADPPKQFALARHFHFRRPYPLLQLFPYQLDLHFAAVYEINHA